MIPYDRVCQSNRLLHRLIQSNQAATKDDCEAGTNVSCCCTPMKRSLKSSCLHPHPHSNTHKHTPPIISQQESIQCCVTENSLIPKQDMIVQNISSNIEVILIPKIKVHCIRIMEDQSMTKRAGERLSVSSSSVKVSPPRVHLSAKKAHTQLCMHSFLLFVRLWEQHGAAEESSPDKERCCSIIFPSTATVALKNAATPEEVQRFSKAGRCHWLLPLSSQPTHRPAAPLITR